MKKLVSTLMIGVFSSVCAMSTMAAPTNDHRHVAAPHQIAKKPMPKPYAHHQTMNKKFQQRDHKFNHKTFDHHGQGPQYKQPLNHR